MKSEPYVATNILERVAKRVALERENKRRGWPGYPGDLWNEQVAVFAPYTVRGMIWYQGESNIYNDSTLPLGTFRLSVTDK